MKFILALLTCCLSVGAATYYVRPTGQGAQDGTSYANAWGGFDAVTGLAIGDTLYISGYHTNNGDVVLPGNMTVRGDYPGDPGILAYQNALWASTLGATNITFRGLNCLYAFPIVTDTGIPGTTHLTFDSCTFSNGCQVSLFHGQDHWSFLNCEFGNVPNGIYGKINSQPSGPNFMTVSNCFIHDCDTAEYPNQDGHAIGLQGMSGCLLTRNRIERTGSAIEFWTADTCGISNNTVSFNFIKDVHKCTVTLGHGIGFSADINGLATSNRAFGNIIVNVGIGKTDNTAGFGVAFNRSDYLEVFNNTISNCTRGVSLMSTTSNGRVENNIVISASQYAISFAGQSTPGDVLVDYNLYYPTNNGLYPSGTHNTHSITGDPKFTASPQTAAADFYLQVVSPAIGVAIPLNDVFTTDYAGTVRGAVWDIGAFEYVRPASAAVLGSATFNGATFQ